MIITARETSQSSSASAEARKFWLRQMLASSSLIPPRKRPEDKRDELTVEQAVESDVPELIYRGRYDHLTLP